MGGAGTGAMDFPKWDVTSGATLSRKRVTGKRGKIQAKRDKRGCTMKSKVNAGILALFFGFVGVHKFYLRQRFQGLIYLVFCWTFVPMILSFVEAIRFFSMTDEQFDARYNKGLQAPAE